MPEDPRVTTIRKHIDSDGFQLMKVLDGNYSYMPAPTAPVRDALKSLAADAARAEQAERDLFEEQAMFRAFLVNDRRLTLPEAAQASAVALADYVAKWMRVFHHGDLLTKEEAMTLQGIREIADDYAALSPDTTDLPIALAVLCDECGEPGSLGPYGQQWCEKHNPDTTND